MPEDLDESSESTNDISHIVRELRQSWDNRLVLPLTKLPERYVRGDVGIVLDCVANRRAISLGKFSLAIQHDLSNKVISVGWDREDRYRTGIDNRELAMFVESIHVVDDANRLVRSIGPSTVRLQSGDQFYDAEICNSLYLSVVSARFVFTAWPKFKHGKFDDVFEIPPNDFTRKVPNDMVKDRPQVVDSLARKHAEAQRDDLVSVIGRRFLPKLVIWMGDGWILPLLDEGVDLGFEIDDILVGPF